MNNIYVLRWRGHGNLFVKKNGLPHDFCENNFVNGYNNLNIMKFKTKTAALIVKDNTLDGNSLIIEKTNVTKIY